MQRTIEKIKPIALLLGLSAIAIGIVWVVNQFKSTGDYYSDWSKDLPSALNLIDETATALPNEGVTPAVVKEDETKVLSAAAGSSNQCANALVKYDSVQVCTMGSGDVDYKPGTPFGSFVRKNARIQLVSATVPLVLMSGSKTVEDSNRKITTKTGVYKPAGEQISDQEVDIELYPNEDKVGYVSNKPFSTKYSVAYEQNQSSPEIGESVVYEKIPNKCEKCNNPSNVNPSGTNAKAEKKYNIRMKVPGGMSTDTAKDENISACSKKDTFREIDSKNASCQLSITGRVLASIQAAISTPIFNECNGAVRYDDQGNPIPPSDDCIRAEDIVVKISSMFGPNYQCNKGVCTNAYMTARNKIALSPTDASKYEDNVYYLTPCVALVDGKETNVRCAWDLSYLFKERKVSEYDDVGSEKTPTKESYDRYLLEQAESRKGDTAIPM